MATYGNSLKRFWNLLKGERQNILTLYVYALFNGIINLSLPLGIQAIINFIIIGQMTTSWVVLVSFVLLGVVFTGWIQIRQLYITEHLQQRFFTNASFEFAFRLPHIKLEQTQNIYLPEFTNRFFDMMTIQKGLPKILTDFSLASLQIVFGIILLSFYHPVFIIFGLALVILLIAIFYFTGPHGLSTSLKESKFKYQMAFWLEDVARGIKTFKLFGEGFSLAKTDRLVNNYLGARDGHFTILVRQYVALIIFKVLITGGLLILGGYLVLNQQMNVGQFVAAEIIIILVVASVEKLILSMENIYDVLTAVEKVGGFTDLELEEEGSTPFQEGDQLEVVLKNLNFSLGNRLLLKDLDLTINAGEHVKVEGQNGSGKSTFLRVLSGLYTDYQGSILLNHQPFKQLSKEALREKIGFIKDEPFIYQGTILENIMMEPNPKITDNLLRILDKLNVLEYIQHLPNGLFTEVTPNLYEFPKSVVQKIGVTRALVYRPQLILIDNFSQLFGPKDTQRFIQLLEEESSTSTIVMSDVFQEISFEFHHTIVFKDGEIIQDL